MKIYYKIAGISVIVLALLSVVYFVRSSSSDTISSPITRKYYDKSTKKSTQSIQNTSDARHDTSSQDREQHPPANKSLSSNGSDYSTSSKVALKQNAPKQLEIKSHVTKEYTYRALLASTDPLSATSWSLSAVKAPQAWNITTGNGAVVAVIDTGFAMEHEDLKNQWFKNIGEQGTTTTGDICWSGTPADKSTNKCDDDNNGYVDDWRGWDFFEVNNDPQTGQVDPLGEAVAHGTEVAGLVGATGNNGVGVATINWDARIMPLQVLSDNGYGYSSDLIAAIHYAVDNGAKVINMSLGGDMPDPEVTAAVKYAYDHNVVVVAAAGNCGTGTEYACDPARPGAMGYPALDDHVIAVGASDQNGGKASFSSYGPKLDVVAPGSGRISSPTWSSTDGVSAYADYLYGTSFASPYVAGLVSLIKSVRPDSSVNDIRAIIDGSATKVATMNGEIYKNETGHGLINAEQAVVVAKALSSQEESTPTLGQVGNHVSEHAYDRNTSLSSACKTQAYVYCTIRFLSDENGYERYMPYQKVDSTGSSSWRWQGSLLGGGMWWAQAMQGQLASSSYMLFAK